jgi:uncharacterized repeat protein (TIGR02543 family)
MKESGKLSLRAAGRWATCLALVLVAAACPIPPEDTTYTVTYDANGGSGAPVDATQYKVGDLVSVSSTIPARHGYQFREWNEAQDGSGTPHGVSTTFTMDSSDVTLFAMWNQVAPYTVTYDANGGSGTVPADPGAYHAGEHVTVLGQGSLVLTDHSFIGWNTAASGSGTSYSEGDTFTVASDVVLYARWYDDRPAMRAAGTTPAGEIGFYVSGGTTFDPMILLAIGGTAQWYFTGYGGGTVTGAASSTSTTPSTTYTGTMLATLSVSPWSALRCIDLGYDSGDGGKLDGTYTRAQQNVTAVQHLDLAKSSLEIWCSSHNLYLTSLSFSGFHSLTTVECYFNSLEDGGLDSIDVTDTPALARLCMENDDLASLDLSGCPNLEDLRAARNRYTYITLPPGGLPKLWHFCVVDNPQLTQALPVAGCPALKECWVWSCSQVGTFAPVSQYLTDVRVYNNGYATLDFSGASFPMQGSLYANNCSSLTSVTFGSDVPDKVYLNSCALTAASIESVLTALDASGVSNGTLDVTGGSNGLLTTTAQAHKASLQGKGWTVTDNGNE